MQSITSIIDRNRVDYNSIIGQSEISVNYTNKHKFGIIIPVRGRLNFLPLLLRSFKDNEYSDYFITVVEHSTYSEHRKTASNFNVNYIYIPAHDKPFNKCLSFNVGVLVSPNADYYIFHDLDCLVQKTFLGNLNVCLETNNAEAIQTFKDKRPLYCDLELTNCLLYNLADVNGLSFMHKGVIFDRRNIGAPGGSILTSRDLFLKIGGYDPELFWGYSPEDEFFLHKLQFYTTVFNCQDNEIFHLFHPPSVNSNPDLKMLIGVMKHFGELSTAEKEVIIKYKSIILLQYVVS